jgi:hypothetical protein
VLLPDRFDEAVPDYAVWQNAFAHIPAGLLLNGHGGTVMHLCTGAETIDDVARTMFADSAYSHIRHSAKRALLIHNNPFLLDYLHGNRIPPGTLVDITPKRFSQMDHHFWNSQRPHITVAWDQLHEASRQVVRDAGTEGGVDLAELLKQLKEMGGAVGMDDTVRFAGYGVAGVSAYAASGRMALGSTQALARELYEEAIARFGKQAVQSKSKTHLVRMQRFLTGHPKYQQLMRSLEELPGHLLPKGRRVPNPRSGSPNAAARHFRKAFSLPYDKWNSSRYFSTIGKQLNGKVQLLKGVGRHATWYVPVAFGLYNASQAPPELLVRTLFEEGFGVLGGYAGSLFGGQMVAAGVISVFAFCGLCLGPLGIFITVFLCASAGGIAGNILGNRFGKKVYDLGDRLNGYVFHSMEELVGVW